MATGRTSVARTVLAAGAAVVAAGAGAGACGASGGTPDEDLAGLVHAGDDEGPAIDVAKAAKDATVLAAAIDAPERRVTAALGPHTVTAKSAIEVSEGGAVVESLTDDVVLADGGEEFHGTDDNSADYGREVIATGGQVYLRPRYARWHARKPEDGELATLRDDLGATLAADFDLLAPAIATVDRGDLDVGGRPARKIALEKAAIARQGPQRLSQKKWREAAEVLAVSGEIVLDAKTAAPLHAHLEGELAFTRDGHRFTMKVVCDHDVSAIGAKPVITPPPAEDTVATPERLREADERDLLLDGMAPPSRHQQPTNVPTTAPGATAPGTAPTSATPSPGAKP